MKPDRAFFLMVAYPLRGPTRVGPAYPSRKAAQGWRSFVKAAWHGLPVHIESLTLIVGDDGQLSAATLQTLGERYNMDPPDEKGAAIASTGNYSAFLSSSGVK